MLIAAGYAGAAPDTIVFSGHTAVTQVTQTANQDPDNDTYFQWRVALTTPFVYDRVQSPNVTVAFDTDTALSFTNASGGTYIAYTSSPDVTITIN